MQHAADSNEDLDKHKHKLSLPFCSQESDAPARPEGVHPPVFSALRQSRVVSSTSEEEEALTEKFLKINCKYITDGMVRQRQTAAAGSVTRRKAAETAFTHFLR